MLLNFRCSVTRCSNVIAVDGMSCLSVGKNTLNTNAKKARRSAASAASASWAKCRPLIPNPQLPILFLFPLLTPTSGRRLSWWGMGSNQERRNVFQIAFEACSYYNRTIISVRALNDRNAIIG